MPKENVIVKGAPSGFESTIVCAIWRQIEACKETAILAGTVPANTYACLNVVTVGDVKICGASGEPLPHLFLTGSFTAPVRTFASAPLSSLSIVFQPWLLQRWFDLDLRNLVNAIVDGADVPRLTSLAAVDALRSATSQPSLLDLALKILSLPQSDFGREASAMADLLFETQSISETALQYGMSVRQFERRFGRNFGLSPKKWLQIRRFEGSLIRLANDNESLTSVATEAGYADQSHMTRDYRCTAGLTPNQTKGGIIKNEPGYWAFKPAKGVPN